MIKIFKYVISYIFATVFFIPAFAQSAITERILLFQDDGKHYLLYNTVRSRYKTYNLFFKKEQGKELDDYLDNYFYFYPNKYEWNTTKDPDYNLLKLQQGDYASLTEGDLEGSVTIGSDGVYTYSNWDGKTKTSDGHYGLWNNPHDFSQAVHVWVIPESFEIMGYECNRGGEWVRRHNTITFYGKNVNDLVFTIKYRPRIQSTYDALSKLMEGTDHVRVEQNAGMVKVTMQVTILFHLGSNELTEKGKSLLTKTINTLKDRKSYHFVINGHTDNLPIKRELAKKYPTNWELSSARSISVLHYLAKRGIPQSCLEARAFSSQDPIAPNNTEAGREKNRRIELIITEKVKP